MSVFGDLLTFLGQERFQQFLEQTPFGVFYELPHIKIQCWLLRHLLLLEFENVKDDMFIVKINGTVLRFEIKEFVAVTGLKCGLLTDFVSDPSIPNRFIQKYFGEMTKVPKLDLEANFFEPEDRFKIGALYFISTFLTSSEASKTTIPKLYFDLVESGQYVNFPWGNEFFRLTLKACSRRLGNNHTSFKFSQFHLALQIWFYECCLPFDNTVAIRVANGTPRILNWKASNENEEMNVIDHNNLHESSSHHETENKQRQKGMMLTSMKIRQELKDLKDNVIFSIPFQLLNITSYSDDALQHVEEIEKDRMDQPSISMRKYTDISNTDAHNSIDQTVGGVFNTDISRSSTLKPPTLDDYPDLTMTQIVELDSILNVTTTPDLQPRNRNPDKYDTSPYIRLSEGESSVRRGPIFSRIKRPLESHNGFEVAAELIDEFNKWVFKDVSSRRDSFRMDFFNIMDKTGWPWEDECIRGFKLLANISWDRVNDVIILVNLGCLHVYDSMMGGALHDKNVNIAIGKLATMIPLFLTSTGFYGKRLDLYANNLPNYVDKSQSDPLEVEHMKCVPQQEESFNDCGLYTCPFVEYISNGVFDMRYVDINAKYHRQRTKNDDGAISEIEVTGTVASKFGGPRIAKEHAPDTSNYPTPRQRRSNLR
ncbi:hypothetical protein H5410_023143 [Solanum commersonii]|uniref:DUF1985 domain-containing protein n=1 Tax=Solanum commersonii TaxID=4109 RepID=A0A9J5ZJY5_SOLCO|nr:hypothetical protein H5410_023143 [Solanum commersonii]